MSIEEGPWTPKPLIMTIESLVAYGFKEWPVNQHDKHDRNWQFCKRDERGKKLFVTIQLWAFSKYSNADRKVEDSFAADSSFDMNGPKTFNVNTNVNYMTPAQVVEWFERMHTIMGCTYYELYADEQYNEDGEKTSFNCDECGIYLPPEDAVAPFLCPSCKYQKDTGFKQVTRRFRPKRR